MSVDNDDKLEKSSDKISGRHLEKRSQFKRPNPKDKRVPSHLFFNKRRNQENQAASAWYFRNILGSPNSLTRNIAGRKRRQVDDSGISFL